MSRIEGYVDFIEPEMPIKGWARSTDPDKKSPLSTTLIVNERVVGHGRTVFREDLGQDCGFEIEPIADVTLAMFLSGEALVQASSGDETLDLPVWQPTPSETER